MQCQAEVKAFYEDHKPRRCKLHGLHRVNINGKVTYICQSHFYQLKRMRLGRFNATIPLCEPRG